MVKIMFPFEYYYLLVFTSPIHTVQSVIEYSEIFFSIAKLKDAKQPSITRY